MTTRAPLTSLLSIVLGLSASIAGTPTSDVDWKGVDAKKGDCPKPSSYCIAKVVDAAPAGGVGNPATGSVLYGVLFQRVTAQIQWHECGPPPISTFNNTFQFYEAFPIVGSPGLTAPETAEDTFQAFGFPYEVFQLFTGDGKYVRATDSNVGSLIAAYNSLPGLPDPLSGHNFVQDPDGSGPLTVPAPGGGAGYFDTGQVPNGTAPPSGGSSFDWANNFGGSAIPVTRFLLQLSICCDTSTDHVHFSCSP